MEPEKSACVPLRPGAGLLQFAGRRQIKFPEPLHGLPARYEPPRLFRQAVSKFEFGLCARRGSVAAGRVHAQRFDPLVARQNRYARGNQKNNDHQSKAKDKAAPIVLDRLDGKERRF